MYIKALEQEVLRIKETFTGVSKERDAFAEENRRLKELLAAHGISYDFATAPQLNNFGSSYGESSSGSVSGGYGARTNSTGYTSPPTMQHRGSLSHDTNNTPVHQQPQPQHGAPAANGMDYDQIGIDFVLTYDRTPYLSPPPQQ